MTAPTAWRQAFLTWLAVARASAWWLTEDYINTMERSFLAGWQAADAANQRVLEAAISEVHALYRSHN